MLKGHKCIAIDEISIVKGHNYLTIVFNLRSGAVVFIGGGKGVDALTPFWKRLKVYGAKIEGVAIDMSPSYIAAEKLNLPQAVIVFDHFHIIKLFNDKLSDLRREIYQNLSADGKSMLKGVRWLLLKNANRISPNHNEKELLFKALRINIPLFTACLLNEGLYRLWLQNSKAEATAFLDSWIARTEQSEVSMLKHFSKTLGADRDDILAFYDFPTSTGSLEETNNKIKTLQK